MMRIEQKSQIISVNDVVTEIVDIWVKCKIPTKRKDSIKRSINKYYDSYRNVMKNVNCQSESQVEKEKTFQSTLSYLFDIADVNALNVIDDGQKEFLICNRQDIGNKKQLIDIGKKIGYGTSGRNLTPIKLQDEVQESISSSSGIVSVSGLSNETDLIVSASSTESDTDFEVPIKKAKVICSSECDVRRKEKQRVVTTEVAAALDRCGVSDRQAVYILSAVAHALGHDLDQLKLSRSSISRDRKASRQEIKNTLFEAFGTDSVLTIHWDGVRLPDTTGDSSNTQNVERLAIVASGMKNSNILRIPKLQSGMGREQAEAIYEALEYWDVKSRIVAMGFDTTASNTGLERGAAFLLAKILGRPLLFTACRHHISELLLGAAFTVTLEPTTKGPEIPLFKRFYNEWPNVNKSNFANGMCDDEVKNYFPDEIKDDIIKFVRNLLENHIKLQRHDYSELLKLVLIFFGEPCSTKFAKPGAISRARWMAKAIYCLKIYLFRNEFSLTG